LDDIEVHEQITAEFHPHVYDKYYSESEDDDEEYVDSNPALEYVVKISRNGGLHFWIIYAPISGLFLSMYKYY
jgi:hypothetical protein